LSGAPPHRSPRSQILVDAIESESPTSFSGIVWRVVTDGFDVLRPGRAGGRWDDGTFDVLYTSSERDGAIAESWFHASKGQPVIPSRIAKRIYKIEAEIRKVLDLSDMRKLRSFGIDVATYGRIQYSRRSEEYPTLQQIAEAAHFYEYQAIIVPNARWPTSNVVVFTEHTPRNLLTVLEDEPVDLKRWYETTGKAARAT
jgi:RES domain-containing protein